MRTTIFPHLKTLEVFSEPRGTCVMLKNNPMGPVIVHSQLVECITTFARAFRLYCVMNPKMKNEEVYMELLEIMSTCYYWEA